MKNYKRINETKYNWNTERTNDAINKYIKQIEYKKFLIIGSCHLSDETLNKLFRNYGFSIFEVDFIDYDEVTNYDFGVLKKTDKYSDIFVGATPHSAKNTRGAVSPLSFLKKYAHEDIKVHALKNNNGKLGLTKENLQKAIINSNKFAYETNWEIKKGLIGKHLKSLGICKDSKKLS